MEILKVFEKLLNFAYDRNWDVKLAKGGYTKEVSLLNHSYSAASITHDLLKLITETNEVFTEKEIELALVSAFLHDLDKELDEFQNKLLAKDFSRVEHLPTFNKFSSCMHEIGYTDVDSKYAFACLLHTHLETGETLTVSSLKTELYQSINNAELKIENISWIGEIIRLADWLSSTHSPSEVKRFTALEDISSLINQLGLYFGFFELSIVRGRLSYLLLSSAEKAFKEQNFVPLVNYPQGMVAVSNKKEFNEKKFIQTLSTQLSELLIQLILQEDFLKNSVNMVVNRSMIGSNEIIGIESFSTILMLGRSILREKKPRKDADSSSEITEKQKNEALMLRLIITLITNFKEKIKQKYKTEKDDLLNIIDEQQIDFFGRRIDDIGLSQQYEPFIEVLYNDIEGHLEKKIKSFRKFDELQENTSLDQLEKIGEEFFSTLNNKFQSYKELSVDTDQYLKPLMNDIQIPRPNFRKQLFETISYTYETYLNAKENAMGSIKNKIRCPICGTAQEGVEAKKTSVGAGTKKFMNLYKGYKPLNNANICKLCVLEGTLRSSGQETFFVFPETPFSPSQLGQIHAIFRSLLNFTLDIKKITSLILRGDYKEQRKQLIEKTLEIVSSDKQDFVQYFDDIRGNYLVLTRVSTREFGNTSTHYAILALSAYYMSLLTSMRIAIVQGIDILNLNNFQKAISILITPSLHSAIKIRESEISIVERDEIGWKLAVANYLQKAADLSKRGGMIDALTLHPGFLLHKIFYKKGNKSWKLNEETFKIFKDIEVRIMEKSSTDQKEKIPVLLSNWLDEYYWSKTTTSSMYSILGPVNTLYDNYRRTSVFTEETAAIIGGKVYRQLENLTKREHGLFEAADEIYQICIKLNEILSNLDLRKKKQYLDDLRYSVYLLQIIKKNERIKKKKESK